MKEKPFVQRCQCTSLFELSNALRYREWTMADIEIENNPLVAQIKETATAPILELKPENKAGVASMDTTAKEEVTASTETKAEVAAMDTTAKEEVPASTAAKAEGASMDTTAKEEEETAPTDAKTEVAAMDTTAQEVVPTPADAKSEEVASMDTAAKEVVPAPAEATETNDSIQETKTKLAERTHFNSDHHKIRLANLPYNVNIVKIKKFLTNLGLEYHKVKPTGRKNNFLFVNFINDEHRDKATDKLNGAQFSGRKLEATVAAPPKDPFLKRQELDQKEDTRTIQEQLMDAVCPLFKHPYEEQLEIKLTKTKELMSKLSREVLRGLRSYKIPNFAMEESNVAVVEPVLRSPIMEGYRNKCEFSVGYHPETEEITVGFRLGSYRRGTVAIAGVQDVPIVSDEMKKVAKRFEEFVKQSGLKPYDIRSQSGHWRHITVRSNRKKEIMLTGVLDVHSMSTEEMNKLDADFGKFMSAKPEEINVVSVYMQHTRPLKKGQAGSPYTFVQGLERIEEEVLGAKFSISPGAFFQVNVPAAELLFKTIGDLVQLNPETSTVLDVCCGTGTIGISLAKLCKKVIGVELVESAVQDAKKNVIANGLTNVDFRAGRAEYLLEGIFKQDADPENTVAIVDPPRAGLHPKAIHALRASQVQKLVYISCDANAAMNNFTTLARPPSKTVSGDPFVPIKVIPVDLFPHTKHVETIVIFERFPMTKLILEEL
eukprot:maker-scaffold263_size232787-snap-gene-1.22 protein:Tk11202 transcript:maker-scaffold263_size232787-snap-gene-1.22-mRNA-1 annotation:"trna (uracil-5-)-methyltransferase homolog a"